MAEKPVINENLACPDCGSECIAFEVDDPTDGSVQAAVAWCTGGHVLVKDKEEWRKVYRFGGYNQSLVI